jgi:hypothetical protein
MPRIAFDEPFDSFAPVSEASLRQRLRSGSYVVSDSALAALQERWGDDYQSWLDAAVSRLASVGIAEFGEHNNKWVIADSGDKLVLDAEGHIIIAAFPGSVTADEVLGALRARTVLLSPHIVEYITEQLGARGVDEAVDRLAEMADTGFVKWVTGSAQGGWRLAAAGDVALIDARGRYVNKLFWSRLDDRPGVGEEVVREALRTGNIRSGRRAATRHAMAWGPDWHAPLMVVLADLAATGDVVMKADQSYEVTNERASVLVSRDAEVLMSLKLTLTGDPAIIKERAASSDLPTLPAIADERDTRCWAETHRVLTRYAGKLASLGEPEQMSTYWRLQYEGVEVTISPDGEYLTGLHKRPTDDPDVARDRAAKELVWTRTGVGGRIDGKLGKGWVTRLVDGEFVRTARGWDCNLDEGTVCLDGTATIVVAWRDHGE